MSKIWRSRCGREEINPSLLLKTSTSTVSIVRWLPGVSEGLELLFSEIKSIVNTIVQYNYLWFILFVPCDISFIIFATK